MSFEVHCDKCGARFTLTDDLYERKVRGRVVTVRCRKCRADITVDGSELGSLPPQPPLEETPTVPLTGPGLPPVGGLWVVSFGDEDDRELTAAQIRTAFAAGEIDADTLVWNTSMDEWLSISEVPELAKKLPTTAGGAATGGFLGTGAELEGGDKPAGPSTPPPLPDEAERELLADDEVGPFKSVAAGTIFVEAEGKSKPDAAEPIDSAPAASSVTEPVASDAEPHSKRKRKKKKRKKPAGEAHPEPPAAAAKSEEAPKPAAKSSEEPKAAQPPPKPERRLPKAPPKLKPNWMGEEPEPAPDSDDDAPPSSRTPALTALTASLMPPKHEKEESSAPTSSDEIYAIGGGTITSSLAPVDLSKIPDEPPPSSASAEPVDSSDELPPTSDAPKKKKAVAPEAAPRKRPRPPSERRHDKPAAAARETEEEKGGSALTWIVLGGAALVAVWWFFLRSPTTADGPTTTPTAPTAATTTQPTAEPTGEPTATPTAAPTAEPTTTAAPSETTKPETTKPETTKPETTQPETTKPETTQPETTKPETTKPETTKPETTKPEASAAPSTEVAMAPPFDAGAAKAALASAAAAASGCRQEGDPVGTATVIVTFAPSGRVTTANVSGPPFAGTKTGGCIAARMRGAKVPAFSGSHVTVSKTIVIQ